MFRRKRKQSDEVVVAQVEAEVVESEVIEPPTLAEELEQVHDAICKVAGRLQFVNPVAYGWLGYASENLLHARTSLTRPVPLPVPAVAVPVPPTEPIQVLPTSPPPARATGPSVQKFVKLAGSEAEAARLTAAKYGEGLFPEDLTQAQIGWLIDMEIRKARRLESSTSGYVSVNSVGAVDEPTLPEPRQDTPTVPSVGLEKPKAIRTSSTVQLADWEAQAGVTGPALVNRIESMRQRPQMTRERIAGVLNSEGIPHPSGDVWGKGKVAGFESWVDRQLGLQTVTTYLPDAHIPRSTWTKEQTSQFIDIAMQTDPHRFKYPYLARLLNCFKLRSYGRRIDWTKDSLREFHLANSEWAQQQLVERRTQKTKETNDGLVPAP